MDTAYIGFGSLLCLRQFASRAVPLSERLGACRVNLSGMFNAGELAGLPSDTQLQLRGIELFLLGAADETREKESA